MKQLVISPHFPFSTHTFVAREVAETIERGHDVVVLAPGSGDLEGEALARRLKIDPERVLYLDVIKSPLITPDWLRFSKRVRTASERRTYGFMIGERRKSYFTHLLRHPLLQGTELIHAHFSGWAYEIALPISELLGIPFTLTAHDSHLAKRSASFLNTLQEKAAAITLPSRAWRDIWRDKTQCADRLYVVPNAVDAGDFELVDVPDSGPRDLKLITVSRLVPHKRVSDGLLAVRRLGDLGLPCHYTVIGAGPEDVSLHHLVKELSIEKRVTFLGAQPHERVVSELQHSDIYLHPSENESFGVAIIEAMAARLPVVAALSAGSRDIVIPGETGQLYPPGETDTLVQTLAALIREPVLREAWGHAGRARVENLYSWDNHMSILLGLWQQIIENEQGNVRPHLCIDQPNG